MPTFAYQAVDSLGKRQRGEAQAASIGAAVRTLEERGLFVLDVAEAGADAATRKRSFRFGRRREVLEFTRAMSALLPVGMPLAQALQAASGVASGDVRDAVLDVRARVERGETLSVSLAGHPRLFSPLYVGLVRAGEKSVDLPVVARGCGVDRGDRAAVLRAAAVRRLAAGKRGPAAEVHGDAHGGIRWVASRMAGARAHSVRHRRAGDVDADHRRW
jgi:type II secretory pathway component PulF